MRTDRSTNLVITEFKHALIAKGAGAFGATARVTLPAVGDTGEGVLSREATHDSQLHDVQVMIEGTGHHGQACAGLLVEGPESQVVAIEIVQHRADRTRKEFLHARVL